MPMNQMTGFNTPLDNGYFPTKDDELSSKFKQFHLNIHSSTGPKFDGFTFMYPLVPFSTTGAPVLKNCPNSCMEPFSPDCYCSHRLNIPLDSIVQITLTAYAESFAGMYYHPVHIHGNAFFVIAYGYGTHNNTSATNPIVNNPTFICDPEAPKCSKTTQTGKLMDFNYINPPKRTSVMVPVGGYVVLRFKADNPGMWPLHCHVLDHSLSGGPHLINLKS